ncbi:pyridoxamine 5'-phosphate oxidase family protein [Nonomuraea sp. NPDC050663]|uniref:pyridoxamine 5'-phosphate oxidase family protein n=1 Tax=Nonomuraea sp. NPDC050663 TaxID=3364370 RepID=UPI0037AF9259
MLHPGEYAVQRRTGLADGSRGSVAVGADVPPVAAEFLAGRRLTVIAAVDDAGTPWIGPVTGPPGFLAAPDARTVVVDRLPGAGDPLAGLFDAEREVGMLVIDPPTRRRMRVNGRARREGGGLVVRTEQVYSNCPKHLQVRTFRDSPPLERKVAPVTTALTVAQQHWIAAADTFFVGTYAEGLGVDASHRGGNPGFVRVLDEGRLAWPDYVGNTMFMTLGNLELEPRCALAFLDWETGDVVQLTGRARVDGDAGRAATFPGAQRVIDFEIGGVVETVGGLGQRWTFGEYSRFNPPITS